MPLASMLVAPISPDAASNLYGAIDAKIPSPYQTYDPV